MTLLDATYRDRFLTCGPPPCTVPTLEVPAGNRIAGTQRALGFAELAWRPGGAIPGEFAASGHDYRADLARFVREAYALRCTDDQLARIEAALRRFEKAWQDRLDAEKSGDFKPTPLFVEQTGTAGAAIEAAGSSGS